MKEQTSDILAAWKEGRGLPGVVVIDGHVHLGDWPSHETFATEAEVPEQAARIMDANGVEAVCAVAGGHMMTGGDYRLGNDRLLRWWKALPERIIPFFLVNPNDRREAVLDECRRMLDSGMRAIKLINAYQEAYPGDGPVLMAVYEFAARNSMILFNHHWSHRELDTLAPQFPDTPFICAHGAPPDLLLKHRNVYGNMWSYGPMGWLDRVIAEAGPGKIMMGSDAFMNAATVGIGPVVHAPVTDADRRLMLGVTVARLLDRAGILPRTLKEKLRGSL
jgi:predicted TIM-barrel fold metal-dependent hydrolase